MPAIELTGQVGANGPMATVLLEPNRAALVQQIHGRHYYAARQGSVWHAQTAVTGVAPGTAIGTTAAFALANPRGSGVNLVVLRARLAYVSGTLGAGVVSYVAHKDPAQAAISGTAIVAVGGLVEGTGAKGTAYTTATVPAGGTPFRPFCSLTALLASTAVQPYTIEDLPDGDIIVTPGCAISLQATAAAGSTPLVVFGVSWEEVAE